MRWHPVRSLATGAVVFGAFVFVVGILFLLVNQGVIDIVFDFWTLCSLGLIFLGGVIIAGTMWGLRMARGGWRKWIEEWESDRDRQV